MLSLADNIQLAHPWFLLLLLAVPLIGWWYWRQRVKYHPSLNMSSLAGVPRHRSWRGVLRASLPLLRMVAFVALVIAMARPQRVMQEQSIEADGIDIMLAIDLSSSMLAQDFKPNRLEVSKRVAADFVGKRQYDRIGVVAFAGEAFTRCPLTIDHSVVTGFLEGLQCGELEDGTAIGMGLATAVNHLQDSEAKSKVVILLTDGVNNSGYIEPRMAASIAQKLGIKVYTIGVGTTGEARTPIKRRGGGYLFGMAQVEIDEELLREIANQTGGAYFRATSVESLEQIYEQIDQLEKSKVESLVLKRVSEAFHPFVFWGILLLMLELVLRYAVLRAIP